MISRQSKRLDRRACEQLLTADSANVCVCTLRARNELPCDIHLIASSGSRKLPFGCSLRGEPLALHQQRGDTIMRFLLSWIVIVGLSHFARGDPVTAAYELMQDGPYSGDPGSTIPAEYNYNGATIPWQRVYTADQLSNWQSFSCHRDLWKDQKLVTCPLSFSDPLPLNFTTLDEGRTQAVYVSPTGMVALTMNHVLAPPQGFIPEDPLRWPMYYMFTSPVWGPLFLWGFNEDVLWSVARRSAVGVEGLVMDSC